MIATAPAPALSAEKFARVVIALVRQFTTLAVGTEWGFMIGEGYDILAWVPREGHLTLQLAVVEADDTTGRELRTVTVCPGTDRAFEVIGAGAVVIGETRGLDAAISLALDYVTAPMRAASQGDHDPCGV